MQLNGPRLIRWNRLEHYSIFIIWLRLNQNFFDGDFASQDLACWDFAAQNIAADTETLGEDFDSQDFDDHVWGQILFLKSWFTCTTPVAYFHQLTKP